MQELPRDAEGGGWLGQCKMQRGVAVLQTIILVPYTSLDPRTWRVWTLQHLQGFGPGANFNLFRSMILGVGMRWDQGG